jgi:hypothetical protein
MADDNSAREDTLGSSESAADPSEPASERLPVEPGNSAPEGENSDAGEDAPVEDAPVEESVAVQHVVAVTVLAMSLPAHKSIQSGDQDLRSGGSAALLVSPENGCTTSGPQQQDCKDRGTHEAQAQSTVVHT